MFILTLFITSCVEELETPFQTDTARINSKASAQSTQNAQTDRIDKVLAFINTVFKEDEQKTNGAAVQKYTKADITDTFEIADAQKKVRLKLLCFQPSGYALINALEDARPQVLWYSQGRFDVEHIHPGLSNYIGEFMEYVKAHPVKENRTNPYVQRFPSGHCESQTRVLSSYNVTKQKGPFLTTCWGQRYPFNNQCPKIGGKQCVAGCVPIAIAQIINYHRRDDHKSYNWERMKNIYAPETSAFIHEIGVAVHMEYGLKESGASIDNALHYFKEAGYSYSRLMDYNYTTLKENIDLGYPVYLSGYRVEERKKKGVYFIIRWGWKHYYTHDGGHAWVADGYKEVTNYEEVERTQRYVYDPVPGPELELELEEEYPEEEYPYGSRRAPITTKYDDPYQCDDSRRYTRSSTTNFVHMNWGWGGESWKYKNNWCTYDYFKPEGKEEYKYKKRMIAFN